MSYGDISGRKTNGYKRGDRRDLPERTVTDGAATIANEPHDSGSYVIETDHGGRRAWRRK